MQRILVTDASTRAALAIVRSLGRAGFQVFATADRIPALGAASRYTAGFERIDLQEGEHALDELAAYSSNVGACLVIPTTDHSMGAILKRFGDRVGSAMVAGPTLDAYEALSNKGSLLPLATAAGIAVPRTVCVQSWKELAAAAVNVGFPCVLKPHRSVVTVGGKPRHAFVRVVEDALALTQLAGCYSEEMFPILVQERIAGSGEGIFILMHNGRRIALFAHRRIREYPPSGGASTYRMSISPQRELAQHAESLLQSVGWTGPAMVEFKRCERTGVAYIMEVNGRFWGSLQLAIDAGVDFPALLARAMLGQGVAPVGTYAVGVRTRWLWGDVDHLLAQLGHGSFRGRLASLIRFLAFDLRDHVEPWDISDPAPFWCETREFLREHIKRAMVRQTRSASARGRA